MNNVDVDGGLDCRVRLDAALAALTMASERLKTVIFSGVDEAIEARFTELRLARMRFLEARAECRESSQIH